MARSKRKSPVLEKATLRISGLRSMTESLEMGNGLSLSDYEMKAQMLQSSLLDYNNLLSTVDEAAARVSELELDLRQYSEKMLLNAGARYGKDSVQYMQAGGTIRKAARRSPQVPSNPVPSTSLSTPTVPTTPLMAAMN